MAKKHATGAGESRSPGDLSNEEVALLVGYFFGFLAAIAGGRSVDDAHAIGKLMADKTRLLLKPGVNVEQQVFFCGMNETFADSTANRIEG